MWQGYAPMKDKLSLLKFLIGWPFAVLALFFIGKIVYENRINLFHIQSLNIPLLALSLLLFVIFFFLRALFWQKLLKAKGHHFSYKQTAFLWGSQEVKRYVPGSIWSILGRSNAYHQLGAERKAILASILQEAEFVVVACFLVSIFCINFLIFSLLPEGLNILIPALLVSVSIFATVLLIFHDRLFTNKPSFLTHFFPNIPAQKLAHLLLLMTASFLLFGVANYVAINAVVPLFLPHIVPLSAFFVFSFIAGYLALFVPMGLGVREGIVTFGLAKYVSLPNAALGAIFSRIVQIAGELMFLALCMLWEKMYSKKLQRLEAYVLQHKYEIATVLSVAAYIAYFSLTSIYRYNNFYTGRFDLGNMDQTVWNTIHGRIFQLTNPDGTNIISRLAFHADFMLIILSPMYLIWQDPRMLLIMQSLAIGIGGLFIFLIARKTLKQQLFAFAFALSYLLYPGIQYANLFDFHAVTIAVPLFLASWYAVLRKHYAIAVILLIIAGTTKEEAWIIAALFGLYLFFWKKQYAIGTILTIVSLGLFYYLFWHAIPAARGAQHFALQYYSDFGSTPTTILKNIVLSPIKIATILLGKYQLFYLLELFAPVLFLPIFALPLLIFASPDLGVSLLSQNTQLHMIYYHYASFPTPFIFLASIYGFAFLQKKFPSFISNIGMYVILVPAIICAFTFGPMIGSISQSTDMFVHQVTYSKLIDDFLQSIPRRYSVAATNNVGSHLSHRQKIYTIPVGLKDADIVVFLLNDEDAQPSLAAQKHMASELDNDPQYVKLFSYQDFVVYKKRNVPTYFRPRRPTILPLFKGN